MVDKGKDIFRDMAYFVGLIFLPLVCIAVDLRSILPFGTKISGFVMRISGFDISISYSDNFCSNRLNNSGTYPVVV
ncbi:MAG: hypothetical protein LBM61_00145 [Prevotellaceae bacterium]|nr:hypothetical protein [Prevotellaceae bacterium]